MKRKRWVEKPIRHIFYVVIKVTDWYREGIGWVYESNRQKVREAEKDLDDFYRQDAIDDLNNAKDAELEILDARIKNWQDYLEMLAEKYNEYNVLEEQRLLEELLGVESEKEVYELIKNDMLEFTEYVDTHTAEFLDNEREAYLAFNTIFNDFMDEYKSNLEKLADLKRQHLELLDLSDYVNQNNYALQDVVDTGTGSSTGPKAHTDKKGKETTVIRDGVAYKAQIIDDYTYDEDGNRWDFQEGDIVKTGGGDYVWEDNRGVKKEQSKTYGDGSATKSTGSKTPTDAEIRKIAEEKGVDLSVARIMATNGYASGIENGPVTYTGLAMLHGSPSNPEYVLNSDQAYSLLRYMSTNKPSFTSNNSDTGTQYVLNGDIILNEVENAAEFWNEVTMAMDRRISVTKNNR